MNLDNLGEFDLQQEKTIRFLLSSEYSEGWVFQRTGVCVWKNLAWFLEVFSDTGNYIRGDCNILDCNTCKTVALKNSLRSKNK